MKDEDTRLILTELMALRGDLAGTLEAIAGLEVAMSRTEVALSLLRLDMAHMNLSIARRQRVLAVRAADDVRLSSGRDRPPAAEQTE